MSDDTCTNDDTCSVLEKWSKNSINIHGLSCYPSDSLSLKAVVCNKVNVVVTYKRKYIIPVVTPVDSELNLET